MNIEREVKLIEQQVEYMYAKDSETLTNDLREKTVQMNKIGFELTIFQTYNTDSILVRAVAVYTKK